MPYIYLITNDINNHQYIGKTEYSDIQKRFKEHYKESKKSRTEQRPLYRAIRKYGIEHFHIEPIEYVSWEQDLEEREVYWIEQYDTYNNGYNATRGGDGKRKLDYQKIINTYNQVLNANETARILQLDRQTIVDILVNTGTYTKQQIKENGIANIPKHKVAQYDKNTNELIAIYSSVQEAEQAVPTGRHIGQVCTRKRKTAGGYIWRYVEE